MLPKNRPGGRQSARLRQTLDGRYGRPITGLLHHQRGHNLAGWLRDFVTLVDQVCVVQS